MNEKLKRAIEKLHELWKKGLFADSPDFVIMKLPDGRYEIRLRR